MLATCLFWLCLLAPGLVVHRAIRPASSRASFWESIALGYLWSFACLMPLCSIGYWLELPLRFFSTALCVLVLLALGKLAYDARRARPRAVSWTAWGVLASVLLVLFLVQAACIGGHLNHDADFHLARIRFLYGSGLSNADPFVGVGFTHTYHTNLLHAVIAAGSRITGLDPLDFWQSTLPWAKLVTASGVAALCMRIGDDRYAAWLAGLGYLGWIYFVDWTLYPNKLAPGWLVPVGLAACIGAFQDDDRRQHLATLAASALVLAVVHGLYAGFLAVLGGGVVAVLATRELMRAPGTRRATWSTVVAALLALSACAPFLVAARVGHTPAQRNFDYFGGGLAHGKNKPGRWTKSLKQDKDGRFALPASKLMGGLDGQCAALLALAALALRRRTTAVIGLGCALGASTVALTVPAFAAVAIKGLGAAWELERLVGVVEAQHLALLGAGIVAAVGTLVAPPAAGAAAHAEHAPDVLAWLRARAATEDVELPASLRLLLVVLASVWCLGNGGSGAPSTAMRMLGEGLSTLRLPKPSQSNLPPAMLDDRALLSVLPAGSTVLAHPMLARQVAKLHDLRFVRSSRNHTGVDDLLDRTRTLHKLLHAKHPSATSSVLLRRYGIRYALESPDYEIAWLAEEPVIGATRHLTLVRVAP